MAIAVGVAIAIRLVGGHPFPDYDATFALIWGHSLAHGQAPDYSLPYRPAAHPLLMLVTLAAAPLGRDGAAEVVRWVALLGAGALVAAVSRLGQALFGTLAGVLAAVLLATRSALWGFALLSYMDPLAAAFVAWAAVLEARRPRRGAAVFVLLALAGLLRPEVWLFAGAYWLWIAAGSRERALRLIPLAALGPLAWVAWDLVTTQTLLRSVTTDQGAPAATSSAGHGLGAASRALARYVGGFVRPPEAAAAAAGLVLLARASWGRVALPVGLAALNVLTFLLVAAAGGPLEQRYLIVAVAMTLVLAGWAIAQIATSGRQPARLAALALALACIAYSPVDVGRIARLQRQVDAATTVDSELKRLVQSTAARCALRGYVHVPDIRLRPFIAYWGGVPADRIGTARARTGTLVATDSVAQELTSRSLPAHTRRTSARSWRLDAACAPK